MTIHSLSNNRYPKTYHFRKPYFLRFSDRWSIISIIHGQPFVHYLRTEKNAKIYLKKKNQNHNATHGLESFVERGKIAFPRRGKLKSGHDPP